MKELIEKIQQAYDAFSAEAALQVEKGNKAAGTRVGLSQGIADLPAVETPHSSLQRHCRVYAIYGVHLSSFQEYVWHSTSESSLQFGSDIIAENTDVSIPTSVFQSYYLLLL